MSLRYLSVCSGIEAATMAWHPLGWTPAGFAEIEPFPSAVLAHHYGSNMLGQPLSKNGVPNFGDFTQIQAADCGHVDLLVGGTPCQDFSVAGLRKGLSGERGNLTLEFLRLAQRLGPRWLVWENVPGVLSNDGGRAFGAILGGMVELGYGVAYRVLDAQYVRVDGFGRAVPQRRRRVFVVGYSGDWRRAVAVLFEREGLSGHPAPRRKAGTGSAVGTFAGVGSGSGWHVGTDEAAAGQVIPVAEIGKASSAAPNGCGLGAPGDPMFTLQAYAQHGVAFGGNDTRGPIQVATALNAHGGPAGRQDFESETFVVAPPLTHNPYGDHESREGLLVAHSLRADGFDASEDGTGRGTPLVPIAFDARQSDVCVYGDTTPLDTKFPGPSIAFNHIMGAKAGGIGLEEECAPTLGTRVGGGAFQQGWAVRRLTPRECERLQGFPDDFTAIQFRGKLAADGPRYKALGNSMAVNVMRWIGRRIEAVDAISASEVAA